MTVDGEGLNKRKGVACAGRPRDDNRRGGDKRWYDEGGPTETNILVYY